MFCAPRAQHALVGNTARGSQHALRAVQVLCRVARSGCSTDLEHDNLDSLDGLIHRELVGAGAAVVPEVSYSNGAVLFPSTHGRVHRSHVLPRLVLLLRRYALRAMSTRRAYICRVSSIEHYVTCIHRIDHLALTIVRIGRAKHTESAVRLRGGGDAGGGGGGGEDQPNFRESDDLILFGDELLTAQELDLMHAGWVEVPGGVAYVGEPPGRAERRYTPEGAPIDKRRGPGVIGFGPDGRPTTSATIDELARTRRCPRQAAAQRGRAALRRTVASWAHGARNMKCAQLAHTPLSGWVCCSGDGCERRARRGTPGETNLTGKAGSDRRPRWVRRAARALTRPRRARSGPCP